MLVLFKNVLCFIRNNNFNKIFLARVDSNQKSNENNALANEFPFIALISGYGSTMRLCLGSLISSQYVLTSASCFYDE